MTGRPPPTEMEKLDDIAVVVRTVDRAGRDADEVWGIGRLRTLVPIEWADRFTSQQRKFSDAVWARNLEDVRKHGEAMLRAYAKLDELAEAAGHSRGRPDQWEFDTDTGLVILVRDRARMNQVDTGGRQCAVWSLDEIASVIRAHPEIVTAKNCFPGAEVLSVRPDPALVENLYDELPF